MTTYSFKRNIRTAAAAALLALGLSLCLAVWGGAQSAALSGALVRLHVLADSDDTVLSCGKSVNWTEPSTSSSSATTST